MKAKSRLGVLFFCLIFMFSIIAFHYKFSQTVKADDTTRTARFESKGELFSRCIFYYYDANDVCTGSDGTASMKIPMKITSEIFSIPENSVKVIAEVVVSDTHHIHEYELNSDINIIGNFTDGCGEDLISW